MNSKASMETTNTKMDKDAYKIYKYIPHISLPVQSQTQNICDKSIRFSQKYNNVKEIDISTGKIVSVFDVASYILEKINLPCSTMKLHKLLYYCQAWSLVWDEHPLFKENIEAWANGPVVRELFNFHKGMYEISYQDLLIGNPDCLSSMQKETINEVLNFYGMKSAQWLIDQTHIELPWKNARKGLSSNERGNVIIPLDVIQEYYSSLK